MSLFSRAHDILNAKANKALDAAEKPDETARPFLRADA